MLKVNNSQKKKNCLIIWCVCVCWGEVGGDCPAFVLFLNVCVCFPGTAEPDGPHQQPLRLVPLDRSACSLRRCHDPAAHLRHLRPSFLPLSHLSFLSVLIHHPPAIDSVSQRGREQLRGRGWGGCREVAESEAAGMGVGGEAGGPGPAQPVATACAAGQTGERASSATAEMVHCFQTITRGVALSLSVFISTCIVQFNSM